MQYKYLFYSVIPNPRYDLRCGVVLHFVVALLSCSGGVPVAIPRYAVESPDL
jgi:hypothetical protein